MILINKIVIKILFLLTFFFIFNLDEIDSNSDKKILYNLNDKYEEQYNTIYFKNNNSNYLSNIINEYNLKPLSYIIDNEKYYFYSIEELMEYYTKDMSFEDKINYEINGIKIDAISTRCTNEIIINLEKSDLILK